MPLRYRKSIIHKHDPFGPSGNYWQVFECDDEDPAGDSIVAEVISEDLADFIIAAHNRFVITIKSTGAAIQDVQLPRELLDRVEVRILDAKDEMTGGAVEDADHELPLLQRLRELGITRVVVPYDGYGDEGAFEPPQAFAGETQVELQSDVAEKIVAAVDALLPGGWEDNNGSLGDFDLDVAAGQLTRNHGWRVDSVERETEVFSL